MARRRKSSARAIFGWLAVFSGWLVAAWLWLGADRPADVASPRDRPPEEAVLEAALADPEFRGAALAFCALDEAGEVVWESRMARTALAPASALKTLTTGAALEVLGPEFRFETILRSEGDDLRLVGGGDPTLSFEDLEKLAERAVAAGLTAVPGELRADISVFPPNPMSDHWNWGDIGNAYGAGAYGLNVNHNRLIVHFQPAAVPGEPAGVIGSEPPLLGHTWANHVTTGPAGSGDRVVVYSEPYGRIVTLRGSVPHGGRSFAVRAALPDPPAVAVAHLRAALERRGVEFGADAGTGPAIEVTHQSAPLREIIGHLHRVSDNLEAQCLFLTLGRRLGKDPATAVREHWQDRGVEFAGLRLLDGSGLARANTIRAIDLARVNHLIRHSEHGGLFRDSLPGGADGSLRSKPGAMSGVRTDVGFFRTAGGREFTYAAMGNALGAGADFWKLRDRLLRALAERAR